MPKAQKAILPLLFLFIFFSIFFLIGTSFLKKQAIDKNVLLIANTLFFLTHFIAFFLQRKALQNTNPHVFVRSMMAGMMIRMLVVLAALLSYVFIAGKAINKPAVYIAVFMYFIYLATEVALILKLNKQKNA